jgi:multiple sugar transport system substrate-binding protein
MRRTKAGLAAILSTALAAGLAACSGGGSGSSSQSATAPVTVLYTSDQVFDTPALTTKWWNSIAQQWKKANPNVKLILLPVGGSETAELNKAAVDFRSPSQTACVLELPTGTVGEFAGSGYLAPLDSYVTGPSAPKMWTEMPKVVQQMSSVDGHVYAINSGNNDSAIYYNKAMLAKAGVKLPWKPTNWQDILTTAAMVKKANPGVWPLWLESGTPAADIGVLQGSANMLYGTSTPQMFDSKTGKWVVDSPGLRATLQFYKTMDEEGLGAPISVLFSAAASGGPPNYLQEGKLAIAVGSNWYSGDWQPGFSAPWPQAAKVMGITPIPTEFGQAPGIATTLGGEVFVMSKACQNKAAAWKFIELAQTPANLLTTAIGAGFIPPDPALGNTPEFIKSALFTQQFNSYQVAGRPLPQNTNFPVYVQALNTATGDFAQNPNTSVATALANLKAIVTTQLGANSVEVIK